MLPDRWWHRFEQHGRPVPIEYADERAFRRWCATTPAPPFRGQINLLGLRPLVAAELKWGLFISARRSRPQRRDLGWIRSVVTTCRDSEIDSLVGFEPGQRLSADGRDDHQADPVASCGWSTSPRPTPARPDSSKPTTSGIRFPNRGSHFDLTGIPQRWLRDLVWDHLADLLQSPRCPAPAAASTRSAGPRPSWASSWNSTRPTADTTRGYCDAEHMHRFVADQRHRERDGLPSLAMKRPDGTASTVTTTTRAIVFNAARKLLRAALDNGAADRIGLGREFIVAAPAAGGTPGESRADRSPTRWHARWPTRTTSPASPPSTTRWTADCATCGKPPCSPAAGSGK